MSKTFLFRQESMLTKAFTLLCNGLRFLLPLVLVLGLCMLGIAAINKLENVEQRTAELKSEVSQAGMTLFRTDGVLDVQIIVDEKDWNIIRHQKRDFFSALQEKRKFGPVEGPFTWVTASATIGGKKFSNVGLRKKGFLGSLDSERPSLKIKLDNEDPRAEINGLTMLTFNNNKQDVSLMSQSMGYTLYNAAGSPAPRCGYAKITVNGKNLGVYSHVESLRRPLLRREFGDDRGPLYEGTVVDFFRGWEEAFEIKMSAKKSDQKSKQNRFKALLEELGREKIKQLTKVLENDDLPDVEQAIGKYVDLDSFYAFWAVEGLLGFWDGYTANNNNFFVYLNPKTEKFHFIPWGLDCAFEKYSKLPGTSRRAPLSVKTKGRVAYRLYQVESCRKRYEQTLRLLLDKHWNEEKMVAEIDRRYAMLKPHLARGQTRTVRVGGIQNFIRNRRMDLTKEIASGMPVWTVKPDPPVILPDIMKLFQPKGDRGGGNIWTLAKNGDLAELKKVVAKGAKVNGHDIMGITPLAYAALTGKTEVMDFLISNGGQVNAKNRDGATPLLGAAFLGRVEAVDLLLAKGADPNIRNNKGETPLDTSSSEWNDGMRGIVDFITGLMRIKVDVEDVKVGRPKVAAALRNQGGKLGAALAKQSNGENKNSEIDIWTAAKKGNIDAIKDFLAKGIEVDSLDPTGSTPLSMTALTGEVEAAKFLISRGADVNVLHKDGATPLHGAAFLGQIEIVKLLLANNAKVNVQNNKGETPLDSASAEWSKVQFIIGLVSGFLKIEVDMEAVKTRRPKAAEILRTNGGKPGSGLNNTTSDK